MSESILFNEFMKRYAPYRLKDFPLQPRSLEEIPEIDPKQPMLRNIARDIDKKRIENPTIGMQLAGKEIMNNLLKWLNTGKGVHAESLLAVTGAMGGYELRKGILDVYVDMNDNSVLKELNIYIAETENEQYLFGEFLAKEFMAFYLTASQTQTPPYEELAAINNRCVELAGKPEYWDTPYNKICHITPEGIAAIFANKFEGMFRTFTRYPQERMLAYAGAAQAAIDMTSQGISKEKAMDIIAQYCLRTMHFIGRKTNA